MYSRLQILSINLLRVGDTIVKIVPGRQRPAGSGEEFFSAIAQRKKLQGSLTMPVEFSH
jgi:hypothetical protein